MTENPISLQVSLPQMLDLALGSPEVGSVNLNILHNFLHVLLHQINLANLKIEYRGDDANRIKTVISSLKAGPSIHLHEYSITDGAGNVIKRTHTSDTPGVAAEIYTAGSKTSLSSEKFDSNLSTADVKETKGIKQKIGVGVEDNCQSVIFVEPLKDGAVPSALGFKKINETVKKLERQFRALEELATNSEIIERIKTSRPDPLNDMWSMININKRLDASEQGISKVMTMLQDIIKSDKKGISIPPNDNQDSVSNSIVDNYTSSDDRLTKLETDLMNINSEIMKIKTILEVRDEPDFPQEQITFPQEHLRNIKEEVYSDSVDMSEVMKESETWSVGNIKKPSFSSQVDQVESADVKTEGKFSPQLSRVSGLATAGSVSGEEKAMIKSNLSDFSSKIPSSESKRSNIGSFVLNELKLDVESLKSEVGQTKQDIKELRYQVEQLIGQEPMKEGTIQTDNNVGTNINEAKSVISKSPSSKRSSSGIKESIESKYSSSFHAVEISPSVASNTSLPGSKELGVTDSRFTNQDSKRQSKSMGAIKSSRNGRSQDFDEYIKNLASRILVLEQKVQAFDNSRKVGESSQAPIDDNGKISESSHADGIQSLVTKISALEQKVQIIDDSIEVSESSHVDGIQSLVTRIEEMRNDVENIREIGDLFTKEKEKSDILTEQIELLKILKADKEDLEDALTDKADVEIVNRKVSTDRFDLACDDLTRNLEAAVSKLTEQENTWSQALSSIHQEVDNKLDKVELSPLEEFINNQFQIIQEKLEELEEERQKNEAAGTKKILNDVLCISCNKNVAMRMDQGPTYKNNSRPFLNYNGERMRKQLKQYPGKNINQFTALMKDTRRNRTQRNMIEKSLNEHYCNRYCGGSHTITTPQQRVMRAGSFPAEWNPEMFSRGVPVSPGPIVCKPEKNVCCSAFNDQLAAMNHQQCSEVTTAPQQAPKIDDQKNRSSRNLLGRQDSKKNQSKQHQEESLNSKNTLPTIIDNEGNVQ